MNKKKLNNLITESLAIEAESAKEAGTLGYMARVLTQATIPHKKIESNEFIRKNGMFTLSIISPSKIGLPYGSIPRLLLALLTTEAVKTRNSEIFLGKTLSTFMKKLDLSPTGGEQGTITRLRQQMQKLFSSSISCFYDEKKQYSAGGIGFRIAKEYQLWWEPKTIEQINTPSSIVNLSQDFFNEIINRPIPIDMRALKALSHSPLALDIYCWLTYRFSYLKKRTPIPWETLKMQFGSNYSRTRDFKTKFLKQLRKVSLVYPGAKIEEKNNSLILLPSAPHIKNKIIFLKQDTYK